MADQKISALTALLEADVQAATDVLPIADISTAETKKVTPAALVASGIVGVRAGTIDGDKLRANSVTAAQIAPNAVTAAALANNAVTTAKINAGAVTTAQIAAGAVDAAHLAAAAVTTASIASGAVTVDKIANDAVTAAQIAAGAVGAAELAANAVTTAAINNGAVTADKIGAHVITTAQIAPDAVTATELADNAVDTAALQDLAVTAGKIAAGAVGTAQIAASAVDSGKLAAGAVGPAALATNAVGTAALQDLAVTTAKLATGAVTTAQLAAAAVDSSKLALGAVNNAALAANAVGTAAIADGAVTNAKIQAGGIQATALATDAVTTPKVSDGAITAAKLANELDGRKFLPQAPHTVLAGPVGAGAATPTFRGLVEADLPKLTSASLPPATSTTIGAVKPGPGLLVDSAGALAIGNAVAAGTGVKVTYNAHGLVTGSAGLTAADIPDLDASKIVSGSLPGGHIASRSISQHKLADYSISYIQEVPPSSIAGEHPIGELWFQESTAKLSMWNGNSWMPVGQGALSGQNLRFCGLFDATNGHVKALTTFGTSDGFTINTAIPAATNQLTGVYLVCDTAGNGVAVAPATTFDPGDWIVCLGQARGWERVDTLNSGGAGASTLDGLTDVVILTPTAGDMLTYTGTRWENRQGNLDPGTY